MRNNQQNHIRTFLYLIQVKVVPFVIISATSYYQFLGSTPFEITHCSHGLQLKYVKIHAYAELILCNEEAHRVSFYEYTLYISVLNGKA